MSRYNHFANHKFAPVQFKDIVIGGYFRKDFFKNGRRRADIICQKTSDTSWVEVKSKAEGSYKFVTDEVIVQSFDKLNA